jgi:amino acid adenylation domain-containing protein
MSQNVEDAYPLTPLQEGMLFHTLEAPGSGVYVERLSCDLRGDADTAVFRSAWEAAVTRHPALRTVFLWQGLDEPVQVVRRAVRLPWQEEDWRGFDPQEREAKLAAWLVEDLRRGFDVARAPLMRIALFRSGERSWRLVWTHHHLLLDGWARVHVMADVLALYAMARRGIAEAKLPPVRPFRDYVAWLKGPGARDLQGAEAFWRRTLAGFTTPTRLALAAGPGPAGEQEEAVLVLSSEATAALQERARRERVTLNTLFQASWALLLARSSGAEDVVYGNVVSGRPASLPGADAMVGPFINTLPVRARMRPAEAAGDWLRRFQEELAAQRRYEHSPLLQVQAWSEVPRGTPLFETLVVFENHPAGDSKEAFQELEVDELVYDSKVHYPVSLIADMDLKVLRLRLKHELAAMDGATASRLLTRLETLLAGLAADADRPVSELPYLSEAEAREVLARSAPAGARALVLDLWGGLAPDGIAGELCIGGDGLAHDYPGRPDLTAERFVPDPFESGQRLYRTGDLARRGPDGALELLGRTDHQAEPGEVEVVPEAPSADLPLTPTQERLAGILSAVLGAAQPRAIRPRDSFLDLGGHSLLATRVVSRVRAAFGVDLPLGAVLNEPTVAALAARIETLMQAEARAEGAPLAPVPRGAGLPLSFAQERLWFLDRMLPGSPLYNVPMAVRAHGPLDIAAFAAALQAVIGRHEILRTTYGTEGGLPVQRIAGEVRLSVPEIDLRGLAPETRETEARRLAGTEARRPFDLAAGPLLRVSLLWMAGDERLVLATFHHMVADGWSLDVFLRDLAAFYRGEAPPPLPVQYADYAIWQRRRLSGASLEAELAYWRQALAGIPWVLELPADRPRLPVLTYRGARELFHLPAETAARTAALGRSEEATPFMVLLALFAILLARLTDREELIVGTPVANRDRIETEGLIGFFMNTLALRISLQGEPGLTALLLRVREAALAAYAHQELPFEKLVEELRPARDLARAPLVQVMFTLLAASSPVALPGVELMPALDDAAESGTARFDLSLHLNDGAEGLAGAFEYNLDLFDAATVRRFASAYATLIAAAVADPDLPFWELPLLTPKERVQLLGEWNDTAEPLPQETAVHRWIEEQARRRPDRLAVVQGERSLTYAELDARAGALARRLAARGLGPERCVALHLERSAEMVVALLAVMKTGGAWLPLDPGHPGERLARILKDAGNPPVLADGDLLGIDEETGAAPLPAPFLDPDGLAYVIFTSGSTGRPKGVQVVRRGLANFLASMWQRPGLGEGDVLLAVTTLAFDISGLELLLPLTAGARVVVAGREDAADGTRLAALLAGHGATAMQATPATWRLLLEGGWQAPPGFKVLCGGEALPGELAARLGAHGAEVWNLYGPTETTIWSAVEPVDPARAAERAVVSLGRPIANTTIHIAGRGLEPVPAGVPGELLIGGAGLARGYLGRPDLTAERFVPDPLGGRGERLYRTGDLARRLPDGRLEFLGRLDHQVKVRGYRIELGEIEAALAEHPAVRHAVVVDRPGPAGERRLVAYAETPGGAKRPPALDEVRAFLRERLPDYMLPVAFVTMDRLPLNPSGKVDRRALPDASPERPVLAVDYIAPREGRESLLAALWSELLGVERVGIRDNFFDLGGHSLLLMRLQGRLAAETGLDLPVLELFEHPTIAALAKRLDELGGPIDGTAGFTAGMNDRAEELRRGKERRAQRRRASEVEV